MGLEEVIAKSINKDKAEVNPIKPIANDFSSIPKQIPIDNANIRLTIF